MKFDDWLFLGGVLGIPRLQRGTSRVGSAGVIALASRQFADRRIKKRPIQAVGGAH